MCKKNKSFILGVWRDPVWSKVIAIGIVALIGVSWAWLKNDNRMAPNIIEKKTFHPQEKGGNGKTPDFNPVEGKPSSPKPLETDQGQEVPKEFALLINRDIPIRVGKSNIAIVIKSRKDEKGFTPENSLYSLLRTEKVNLIVNLFKEKSFKAKGFFREIYDGNTDLLRQAKALSKIDFLILGELSYSFQKDSKIDSDLISCNINFSYKTLNKNAEIIKSDTVSVIGPGFSENAALGRGLEILAEQYSDKILTPNH